MVALASGGLALRPARGATLHFGGLVGRRLQANLDHWLLVAPQANPAMLEIFRDRDRSPRRDLVPWAGEFAGKYLTSAVLCYRIGRDERLRAQINWFVEMLIAVQDRDGYLGAHPRGHRLTGTTADGKHRLWDIWGHYHCMLGLYLWYKDSGHAPSLAACLRAADHICARFLNSGERVLDAGAEEMNMAVAHILALLHQETGEPRYLQMVREIERDWQTPPAGDYVRTALAGLPFHRTPKPRWESLHDIQALLPLYEITGESTYCQALAHAWRSIVSGDRHNTGGFSSGEKATGNPFDEGAIETCCTVAWMALSVDMLRLTGKSTVADELELSTLNATLGAQSPSGRWWTYNTPMDGVRKASAHDIVFQAREGSPELNCCSVNGPRSLGMLSEWCLMQSDEGLALNYYGPSRFSVRLTDACVLSLSQETDYPRSGRVEIRVGVEGQTPGEGAPFTLSLRIPAWSRRTRVAVNGEERKALPRRYLDLRRLWHDGDKIVLDLDMGLREWVGEREQAGRVSLYRGPLLLAHDPRFSEEPLSAPAPNDSEPRLMDWQGAEPDPWLLLGVPARGGGTLTLCDFASAGVTGTPYRTWLPRG